MISEELFAQEEWRLGKKVHFHDGVWWVKVAPFYYKPIDEFRPFQPKSARPNSLKALLGYSHQVSDPAEATRFVRWMALEGEDLRNFSLERLHGRKRSQVRMALRECRVEVFEKSDSVLEQMRLINIAQAKRFERGGEGGTFLPSGYYEIHKSEWREMILRLTGHQGHRFIGAFAGDTLIAYVNLLLINDTVIISAVKSYTEYTRQRPVDALYFTILSEASQNLLCRRVVNGGPDGERESLTHFKEQFLFRVKSVPYYTRTVIPLERLRNLLQLSRLGRERKPLQERERR